MVSEDCDDKLCNGQTNKPKHSGEKRQQYYKINISYAFCTVMTKIQYQPYSTRVLLVHMQSNNEGASVILNTKLINIEGNDICMLLFSSKNR